MNKCPHCGFLHDTTCPRIKVIEYQPDGFTVKRIEFFEPNQPCLHTARRRDNTGMIICSGCGVTMGRGGMREPTPSDIYGGSA